MLNFFICQLLFKNIVTHVLSIDLTKLFNLGFVLAIFYVTQICSGVILAFQSEFLKFGILFSMPHNLFWNVVSMGDGEAGFWIRSGHVAGTSMVYALIYAHIVKVMWVNIGANVNYLVLFFGEVIFVLSVGIAFLGYVLPLSQMSYWGLVVFSNIIGVVPLLGKLVLAWLWGGEFIGEACIMRVLVLHIFLPFLSIILVIIHIIFLHVNYSSCGFYDRGTGKAEAIFFSCSSLWKDLFALGIAIILFLFIWIIYWTLVFHEESFLVMNSEKTSSKIIPEWFFLAFFGFLKAIPSKLGGLICLLTQMLLLPFSLILIQYQGTNLWKSLSTHLATLWVTIIIVISLLAAMVVLLYPVVEFLGMLNILIIIFIFFKIM